MRRGNNEISKSIDAAKTIYRAPNSKRAIARRDKSITERFLHYLRSGVSSLCFTFFNLFRIMRRSPNGKAFYPCSLTYSIRVEELRVIYIHEFDSHSAHPFQLTLLSEQCLKGYRFAFTSCTVINFARRGC